MNGKGNGSRSGKPTQKEIGEGLVDVAQRARDARLDEDQIRAVLNVTFNRYIALVNKLENPSASANKEVSRG